MSPTPRSTGGLVIYVVSPAFFLHAFDGETGEHIEDWGEPVDIPGFPKTGVVDLLAHFGYNYDPYEGLAPTVGYITNSSPPIVVNGTIVVGNSAAQGYHQTRIENVPGDILAFDARTGDFKWKFNVTPRSEDDFAASTWENDAWKWTGDVSSWAPLSADLERDIVYIPTNAPTIDFYGGFRPGRQPVRDQRDRAQRPDRRAGLALPDHPPPDLEPRPSQRPDPGGRGGERRKGADGHPDDQAGVHPSPSTGRPASPCGPSKRSRSRNPSCRARSCRPPSRSRTWPAPVEMLDLSEDNLIDYTPELRQKAIEIVSEYTVGGPYMPPIPKGYSENKGWIACGVHSAVNITHPAALDPATGILYQSSGPNCSGRIVQPGVDADQPDHDCTSPSGKCTTIGETVADWVNYRAIGVPGPDGLPIYKPPYSRVTAIDMNTGEHLWWVPIGEPNDRIKNHPALEGVDLSNVGGQGRAILMVSGDLLLTTEGMAGPRVLNAHDKRTGEKVGSIELPAIGDVRHDDLQARGKAVHRGADRPARPGAGVLRGAGPAGGGRELIAASERGAGAFSAPRGVPAGT